jgi:flagellar protein FlbD
MIRLTRLNKQPIGVNSDLIKFVESSPDTVITLITGEKIVVRESYEQVVGLIVSFRRRVLTGVDLLEYGSGAPGNEAVRQAGAALPAAESGPASPPDGLDGTNRERG